MELSGLGRRNRVPSQSDSAGSDFPLSVESRPPTPAQPEQIGDHLVRNGQSVPVPVPAVPAGGWRSYVFILPIISSCIALVGAIFGIKNYAFLESAKTLNFVRTLSPILTAAHAQIITRLDEIAELLRNGTDKP